MRICSPNSDRDFAHYYQLRWEMLRAPWQQPKGSEQDEFESLAFHIMAINQDDVVIGVGRLHSPDSRTGQIRYMAVRPQDQQQGVGSSILKALEQQALQENYTRLILNARDSAVRFYHRHGYTCLAQGETLFGKIKHTQMQKIIRP